MRSDSNTAGMNLEAGEPGMVTAVILVDATGKRRIDPLGARVGPQNCTAGPSQNVRERLRSYGSHNRTALHHLPVSEQRWSTPGQPGDPLMCTSLTTAKPLEFLGCPTRQGVVQLE